MRERRKDRSGSRRGKKDKERRKYRREFTLQSMMRDLAVLRSKDLHEARVKRISGLTISVEQVCLYDAGIND